MLRPVSLTIDAMLEHAARVAPGAVAATLDGGSLTFGELDREANRIANALLGRGIGAGDRVLWWSETSLAAVPVFAALAKIGAVFAPLNARGSVEELAPVAEYAQARLLLVDRAHAEAGAELARVGERVVPSRRPERRCASPPGLRPR